MSTNVLLLQWDVDDTTGLMFGDDGDCQFLLWREELLNRGFSRVEYEWQCF